MAPPIVTAIDKVVLIGDSIDVSDLFSVSDPDGDDIIQYDFMDGSSDSSTGRMSVNGAPQSNGSQLFVDAANLHQVQYVAGNTIGMETFYIRAADASGFGSQVAITLYTARENTTLPVVNATNFSVQSPELIAATEFLSPFDPDGWPITEIKIRDRLLGRGKFRFNGVFMPEGEFFTIAAKDLDKLFYLGAGYATREPIDIFVYDGVDRSERQPIIATTDANFSRPVVLFEELDLPTGGAIDLYNEIDWEDADENTAKRMRVLDTSPQGFSKHVRLNGRVQPAQQWIEVSSGDFGALQLVGGTRQHSSLLRVQVFDGRYWSRIQNLKINTVERPVLGSDEHVVVEQLEHVAAADLFDKLDSGPTIQGYQVIDGNDGFTSGRFVDPANVQFAANQVHDLTPTEFGNLRFRGASYGVRQTDDIYARAFNGTFWSSWKRIEVSTEPNYEDLMLRQTGPGNYNEWLDWLTFEPDPRQITYSFMLSQDYNPGELAFDQDVEGFVLFNDAQRAATRTVLAELETLLDVRFIEVADVDIDSLGRKGGVLRFGNFFDDNDDAPGSISFEPNHTIFNQEGGDVWFNRFTYDTRDISKGTGSYYSLMSNIARAMGQTAPGVFPGNQNWSNFTVQSFALSRFFVHGGFEIPSNYSLYDIYSLQRLYGANNSGNSGDSMYDIAGWLEGNQDRIATIWDGDGVDTLSAVGAALPGDIDLREGTFSSIGSIPENVGIGWGVKIENAIGSDLGDTIVGNQYENNLNGGDGDDDIWSGAGNDFMTGGRGSDLFRYKIGDGNDWIDENRLAGADTIMVESFAEVDNFSEDVEFKRLGRNLVIDFTINRGDSQGSITVTNQLWGGSRVETINFNGVRVDLLEIFAQATSTGQNFELLSGESRFGFLSQPVA